MFRPMKRTRQELPLEECARILADNSAGVLATAGAEGYPYAVPLSYVYLPGTTDAGQPVDADDATDAPLGSIVFHCALSGHKVEALRKNPRASFCVIDRDEPVPEEFATHYASVIAFVTARFIEGEAEKRRLLTALGTKYSPGLDAETQAEIDRFLKATCVIALDIDHLTGKQAKALASPPHANA